MTKKNQDQIQIYTVKETRFTLRDKYLAKYLTIFRANKENFITLSTKVNSHSTIYNAQVRLDNVDKSGMDYSNITDTMSFQNIFSF